MNKTNSLMSNGQFTKQVTKIIRTFCLQSLTIVLYYRVTTDRLSNAKSETLGKF